MPCNRSLIRIALVAMVLLCAAGSASAQASLDAMLMPFLGRYDLPALAVGAVGTRKLGAKLPVTVNDRFHLGSDTKAMTVLLTAMLVEEGKLRWDSTVAEVFPELAEKMDLGLRRVTIEQLLMEHGRGQARAEARPAGDAEKAPYVGHYDAGEE